MPPLTTGDFVLRLACAVLCGLAIGVERQWRQRSAGLRTYALVALGSALFVAVGCLIQDASPTRIASYVVSGVGFLGAGVIMRSGMSVRGMNTAATIWCSSAIGMLAGYSYFAYSIIATAFVLAINVLLRPLVKVINRCPVDLTEQDTTYEVTLNCSGKHETHLRSLLVQLATLSDLALHELASHAGAEADHFVIRALFSCGERHDQHVEQLVSRLSLEKSVYGVTWKLLPGNKTD